MSETDEMFKRTMGINLEGVIYCSREQIRVMMELPKLRGVLPTLLVSRHQFMGVIRMVMVVEGWRGIFVGVSGKGCCTAWGSGQLVSPGKLT